MSLSAPPLLPSASAPTLENHVSRITATLTATPFGAGTAALSGWPGPGFVSRSSNTVLLTSSIFSTDSQPRSR